jgi:predicted porin
MAEATLYGKLHVHLDYAEVDNAIAPTAQFIAPDQRVITDIVENDDGTITIFGTQDATGEVSDWELTTTQAVLEANPGVLGEIIFVDENGDAISNNDGQDFSGWGMDSQSWSRFTSRGLPRAQNPANRLGVKGSEDLGNGLKAIYQVELGVQFASADNNIPSGNNGNISIRNSFVGLAGDWGTFLVGRHDTPFKISSGKLDLFVDTIADYNGTVGFDDRRTDNTVAYISPSFSGFSVAAAVIAGGGANALNDSRNVNSDSLAEAYSLAAIYNNGPFYASAAYEVLSSEMFMNSTVSEAGRSGCFDNGVELLSCNYVEDDYSKWRLGLGLLDWNGFSLTAIYEQQDDLPGGQITQGVATISPDGTVSVFGQGGVKEQRLWQVQAGYAFGNSQVKAMYGSVDRDADKPFSNTRDTLAINNIRDDLEGDRETWAIGFDHNFSKRTKAYALYTDVDDDQDGLPGISGASWSGFSLGMVHAF